ncbi:MAG: DMT family transporter [Thermoguttaceae bacterium]|jgi:drug/metabolite transporter (DMT)-like permease
MDTSQLGELAAIGTAFLWTLSALAWTSAGKDMGALAMSFIRLMVTCVFLSIYGQIFLGSALPLNADGQTWLLLATSGFFGFFIADLCLFKAFLLIGPRVSLLIQSLTPPLSAIMAWIFLGDKLLLKDWIGMAITLSGVVWVILERPETPEEHRRRRHIARGVFLAVVAAVSGAVGLVFSKKGIGNYDAAVATYIRVIGALAGYVVLLTLVWRWPVVLRAVRLRRAMGILMFGSFVGPFLGVILCMVSLRYCHAGVVSTIINTMPVLILPFIIVLYHEKVSLRAGGGAVLSVLGVAMLVL